jgi:hypothetical protein
MGYIQDPQAVEIGKGGLGRGDHPLSQKDRDSQEQG